MALPYRRIRMFCGLSQNDVSRHTGISIVRLSRAEAGRLVLLRPERMLLEKFLLERLRVVADVETMFAVQESG